MSTRILYDAVVGPGANEYYGTLVVSNIHYDGGGVVNIKEFLGVEFLSPATVAATDINASTSPWAQVNPEASNEQIDPTTYSVTAKLIVESGVSWAGATINIGINGDLTKGPDRYVTSFVFAADAMPDTSGTANIDCAASSDKALDSLQQAVTFTMGGRVVSVTVPLGETTPSKVPPGTYAVTAADLATADETTAATAQASPSSVTVVAGETVDVGVTYGAVARYSAIDVTIGRISPLEKEQFLVRVVEQGSGKKLAEFSSPNNHTTSLRRLPPSGTVDVSVVGTTLNNVQYSFDNKTEELSPSLIRVSFLEGELKTSPIDITGFATLPIVVTADVTLDATISVRLTSDTLVYTQDIKAESSTTDFAAPVGPGIYTVQAAGILDKGTVYVVNTAANLTVTQDGRTALRLTLQRGANLHVRGFPGFLSFGGCSDLTAGNEADFVAARASSIFKHAGTDGAGDSGTFLTDDQATRQTIALARSVEAQLADGSTVLPVMVSYTCNMSGGNPADHLQNVDGLARSFANLILSLNLANATIDDQHPVPAGCVINPGFIGACQQDGLSAGYRMKVREPLTTALDYWGVSAEIPGSVTEDLRGYVLAVNWLIRTVAPAVTFGWPVNLWGVGASTWVYQDDDVADAAQQTGDYAKTLGVFDGDNMPDFLVVDRYEADDFTVRAYGNGYCYGPREWGRFFDFCAALSARLRFPIMPWQIPSSWTPLTTDTVNDDFDSQHWGTGGSYIMGDAGINSDYRNINPKILALRFSSSLEMGGTAENIFTRAEPFDLTDPAYAHFPLRGIFAVLLGGGATTGIVASVGNPQPWVRDKLYTYMENPISLNE
ncbi:hypothetical protein TOPH_07589 [Tolypocladium ophioglossoides CBS 100239]|uniref:Uncharacterized protein n=1 Tax=Tolypocladium ophioglossoides (strain CBS 100239) TaxID=1163406 RepID=A0A0L0N0Z4_TOLOC|nr:hypothetical protein TOPH_07589 [Tolypocladium ophioglossoides CBS 100239]